MFSQLKLLAEPIWKDVVVGGRGGRGGRGIERGEADFLAFTNLPTKAKQIFKS